MPCKLAVVPWLDAQGNPVVEYRPPLDGATTFRQFLTTYEGHIPPLLAGLGLLGMVVACFHPTFGDNRAVLALSLFMPATTCLTLILSRSSRPPIPPFHLWDMIRDVPLWYGGIVFGLFALVFLDCLLARLLPAPWSRRALIPLGLVVAAFAGDANVEYFRSVLVWPCYTTVGGFQRTYWAQLCEAIVRHPSPSHLLFLAKDSEAMPFMYSFQMYGHHIPILVNCDDAADAKSVLGRLPATLVGKPADVSRLLAHPLANKLQAVEVAHFPEAGESLFALERSEKPAPGPGSATSALAPVAGAYSLETLLGTPFRWMRQEGTFDLSALEPGPYLLEGAVMTNSSTTPNELTLLLDGEPVGQVTFASPDIKNPDPFSVPLRLTRPVSRLTFRCRGPEANFANDDRPVAYGLVYPLTLTRADGAKPDPPGAKEAAVAMPRR
jgi:hypothetical protein